MEIRRALASDYGGVCKIRTLTIGGEYFQKTFEDEIQNTDYVFIVAQQAAQIWGYGILELTPPEASVIEVAVRPESQGQGLGKTVLKHLLEEAGAKNCCDFFLEVRESNWRAQKLYVSAGFVLLSRRKAYYKNPEEDALMFCLRYAVDPPA